MKISLIILITLCTINLVNADVSIHQVFYDREGTDDGYEWIELSTDTPTQLKDYKLFYSSGEDWKLIFDGDLCGCSILDYFLIGQPYVDADYFGDFSLGNSKGALKLTKNETDIEILGYGDSIYFENHSAIDVASNKSLLRINNTGDNFRDFISSDPIFSSSKLKQTITIVIKQKSPEVKIRQLNALEAYTGESTELDLVLNINGDFHVDLAGILTNKESKITIPPISFEVHEGDNQIEIPFTIPLNIKTGEYSGKLEILVT